jgi:signal transduction histidine kinase
MSQRRLAVATLAVTGVMSVGGLVYGVQSHAGNWLLYLTPVIAVLYVGAGALLVSRLPTNRVGWIVIGVGFFQALNVLNSGYANYAIRHSLHLGLAGQLSGWASTWSWYPSIGLLVTFLPLLFPDGRPPSARWRWVGWLAAVGIAIGLAGLMSSSWHLRHGGYNDPNYSPGGTGGAIAALGTVMAGVAAVSAIVSLVVRRRRARGDERQQLRWFMYVAGYLIPAVAVAGSPLDRNNIALGIGFVLLPITIAVAVLKYRLYDIDVVIKKTAIALVLTILIGGPVLFILGIASQVLIWGVSTRVLTLVGGIALGLAIVPLIRVARRLADRIVYGRRATSYEVLTDFSKRMAETYSTEDVLERMASILAAGTGAARATIWLTSGAELRPGATSTSGGDGLEPFAIAEAAERGAYEVRHRGELLGAITVDMPANDPMNPAKEGLIHDLAAQAGPVLRNVKLIEDLRASRQRLVAAQDQERRRIERNIHDGAQQQLVALSVKLRLAEQLTERDPARSREMLGQLQADTSDALENLRDLARGIYPPLLADRGLAAALEAQARKSPVPTTVEPDGVGRYAPEIEATVYFCALEALQNVAKYAEASSVTVRLSQTDGQLRFEVADDGRGFDQSSTVYGTGLQGMADRLDAVGGSLVVESSRDGGTTVTGILPVGGGT